jgi:spermidine synthase
VQTLHFPQPVYPSGWWTCTMAAKHAFKGFRIEDSVCKSFPTRYYNAEVHQGALALPPFMKEAFEKIRD